MRKSVRKRQRAENRRKKAFIKMQLAGPSTIDNDDDHRIDILIASDEGTEDKDDDE
jgi:hypothetical protein